MSIPQRIGLEMKIVDYKEVPLDRLIIGQSHARTRDVLKNLEELERSIQMIGLLEPIVLAPADDDQYEVVAGQRRFLAVERLGWPTIRAGILDARPDGDLSKAISLTENMVREDMNTQDYIDACTVLFRRYGTIKMVSEELGLPIRKVSQYVKFDQLTDNLQDQVKNDRLKLDVALRAQKAATSPDGEIDEGKAEKLAEEMKGMAGLQQQRIEQEAKKNPDASAEDLVELGRRPPREKRLTVTLSVELHDALDRYADDEGTDPGVAAVNIIEKILEADCLAA